MRMTLYDAHCRHGDVFSTDSNGQFPHRSNCVCTIAADATALSSWAEQNNTVFNASKSVSMVISRSRMRTVGELFPDGDVISCSGSTKHPGVVITAKLLWSTHIDRLLHKVALKVSLMKWMAFHLHLPRHVISRCYLSMVRPVLEYASPV